MKRLILCVFFALELFCSISAHAKVYYTSKGVKFHIGDNRFALSEDSTFVGANPSVGQEWVQEFKVSQADHVKVHIDKIWGVDDCPYCKVIISIDGKDMLRLFQSNNNNPVDTPEPLVQYLQPGVSHFLKIASYGSTQVDDFMIQDVSVETQAAEVEFVGPPVEVEPEATPTPVVHIAPCESAIPNPGWMPGEAEGKRAYEMSSKDNHGLSSGILGKLAPGEAIEFLLQVDSFAQVRGIVDHSVEITLQDGEKEREGWVMSFKDAQGSQLHGNMIRDGVYRSEPFVAGNYQASSWNRVRLQSCADGQIHLLVNNKEASLSVPSAMQPRSFALKVFGLRAGIANKNPLAPPPALLAVPGGL
jgi:hypothetical protein